MKLTQEQKEEIVYGIDGEGLDYYFVDYTHKWEEIPSEIQQLVIDYRKASKALESVIDSWDIEVE